MSSFEALDGVLNIAEIIGIILRHVNDFNSIKSVLQQAKARADLIYMKIQLFEPLEVLTKAQSKFTYDTVQDFDRIHNVLVTVYTNVSNRTTARVFLTSPNTLAAIQDIEWSLANKEHNIQMMGMICSLVSENRVLQSEIENISRKFSELKDRLVDTGPAEAVLVEVCQIKCTGSKDVCNTSELSESRWLEGVGPGDKLAIGISWYNGNGSFGKDYEKAARHLNAAVRAGMSEANYYLGKLYQGGLGVERCDITAVNCFKKGAVANDPKAMTQLGSHYIYGLGVETNITLSVQYIEMGANAGDPLGMSIRSYQKLFGYHTVANPFTAFQLGKAARDKGFLRSSTAGHCYMHGLGVERDSKKAVELWTEAANAGSYTILTDLAQCYEQGLGVKVDSEKAAEFYKKGSYGTNNHRQHVRAMPYYGLCLIRGRGVQQDIKKGLDLIQNSVQVDNGNGWFVQGECYRYGYGVKKNFARAIECYERATIAEIEMDGKKSAHFTLGSMYESGDELRRDMSKAFKHFDFGANHMDREAQFKVALWCESGTGTEQDVYRAVHFFKLAANSGHTDAQIKTFKYYMKGKGVQRNFMTAVQILQPAADSGDKEAKHLLRVLKMKRRCSLLKSKSWVL